MQRGADRELGGPASYSNPKASTLITLAVLVPHVTVLSGFTQYTGMSCTCGNNTGQ